MTPCWMISLVTPGIIALLEKQPLPGRPWECLLLIPQLVWLQAAGANPPRLHFSPMAIISLCPLVDSWSLLLHRDTDYLLLRPPEPLSHQVHLSLSRCGLRLLPQDAAPQICRRQSDLSFSAACVFQFSSYLCSRCWLPGSYPSSDFPSPSEPALILLC